VRLFPSFFFQEPEVYSLLVSEKVSAKTILCASFVFAVSNKWKLLHFYGEDSFVWCALSALGISFRDDDDIASDVSVSDLSVSGLVESWTEAEEGDKKWQPLHYAASHGCVHGIKFILEDGADVNAVTSDNKTPLDVAIEFQGEHHPVTKKLRDLGAVAKAI